MGVPAPCGCWAGAPPLSLASTAVWVRRMSSGGRRRGGTALGPAMSGRTQSYSGRPGQGLAGPLFPAALHVVSVVF